MGQTWILKIPGLGGSGKQLSEWDKPRSFYAGKKPHDLYVQYLKEKWPTKEPDPQTKQGIMNGLRIVINYVDESKGDRQALVKRLKKEEPCLPNRVCSILCESGILKDDGSERVLMRTFEFKPVDANDDPLFVFNYATNKYVEIVKNAEVYPDETRLLWTHLLALIGRFQEGGPGGSTPRPP